MKFEVIVVLIGYYYLRQRNGMKCDTEIKLTGLWSGLAVHGSGAGEVQQFERYEGETKMQRNTSVSSEVPSDYSYSIQLVSRYGSRPGAVRGERDWSGSSESSISVFYRPISPR